MKKILFGLILGLVFVANSAYAVSVLRPSQGGTGIGSATAGDVGTCLKVSDDTPFTFELGACGSGSGGGTDGNWTFFNNSGIRPATSTVSVLINGTATTTRASLQIIPTAGLMPFSVGSTTTLFEIENDGNVGIGTASATSKLTVAGDVSVSGNVVGTGGTTTFYNGASGAVYIRGGTSQFLSFGANNTNDLMRLTSGGNLGIATTTPDSKLTIYGGTANSTFTQVANFIAGSNTLTSGAKVFVGYAPQDRGGFIQGGRGSTANGILSFGTRTTSVDTVAMSIDGTNIGIGTTTPQQKLSVSGGNIAIAGTSGTNALLGNLQISGASYPKAWAGIEASTIAAGADQAELKLMTAYGSTTEKVRITALGNVGIGTTTPNFKLDVNGSSGFRSYSSYYLDATLSGYIGNGNGLFTGGSSGDLGIRGANNLWLGTSLTPSVAITNAGNVGIGTTTPAWKFQVAGTRPDFTLSDSAGGTNLKHIVFSNRTGNLYVGPATDAYATSTPILTLLNGGNVGIASTSPMSLLAVAGTITANNINATSTTATSIFSGILQVVTRFIGVISAAFTPSTEGEIGIDTTSNQFKYFSGGAVRVVSPVLYSTFTISTSTAWTATSTKALGTAYVAETWVGIQCFTDTGTVNVSIYDGTNRMNMFNASTTVGTVTLSTNNTFTAGEKRYVDVGTPASSPTSVSCTVAKTIDAD